ncbi:MAG: transposase [Candidatus Altiarchaeales archaeon HGW-Altiarchaeales-1]|nr:MAG: transposase [Candidatus Altiarchaeales archaeon HGW-Altiarchaeales-1]
MEELRTFTIQLNEKICTEGFYKESMDYLFTCRQFENLLLILLKENYERFKEGKDTNDFRYLTNAFLMQNVLFDYDGKAKNEKKYITEKYSQYPIFQELLKSAKAVGHNNAPSLISRVKNTYTSYFELLKAYEKKELTEKPNPPQPKKLSKIVNYAIDLNNAHSVSLCRLENMSVFGINLNSEMKYIIINPEITDGLNLTKKKIKSAKLVYSNGYLYLQTGYYKEINETTSLTKKDAGLDIGIKNIISCFVDDNKTPSLVINGGDLQSYNNKFNNELSALQTELTTKEVKEWGASKTGTKYPKTYTENGIKIKEEISVMFEERKKYFKDQFHKISKGMLEYLHINKVTDLYISNTLAELKNNGKCKLKTRVKRDFIQIPFLSLFEIFKYKAKEYNISLHFVDEAYTSKTSCITANINKVQEKNLADNHAPSKPVPLNWVEGEEGDIYKGKRTERGLFKDTILNKVWNADLNGAVNILKIGVKKSYEWLKNALWKLSSPIKCSVCELHNTCTIASTGLRYRTQRNQSLIMSI